MLCRTDALLLLGGKEVIWIWVIRLYKNHVVNQITRTQFYYILLIHVNVVDTAVL